jgi:hypothetical protein
MNLETTPPAPPNSTIPVDSAPEKNLFQQVIAMPVFWFALALMVRVIYLLEQQAMSVLFYQPLLDERELVETAQGLLNGDGFGPTPFFKAPLYPIILAGVMAISGEAWPIGIRLLQHLVGALLVVLGFDTARRLVGPGRQGSVAAIMTATFLAFYAPLVRLENRLLLDFFTVFFQSVMLWALIRTRLSISTKYIYLWALLAGFAAALAWLNRPTLTPVLPFLALWLVVKKRTFFSLPRLRQPIYLKAAFCFIAPIALAISAFTARNTAVSGEALWLPWQGGYGLYYATLEETDGRYLRQERFIAASQGSANPTWEDMVQQYLSQQQSLQQNTRRHSIDREQISYGTVSAFWFDKTKQKIGEQPVAWLTQMIRKGIYLTSDREVFNIEDYSTQRSLSRVLPLLPFSFGWIFPLACLSIPLSVLWPAGRRPFLGICWLYSVLLAGAIALYYTSGRFRMPLVFPVAVLAGSSVSVWIHWDAKAIPPRRAVILRSLMILAVLIGLALSWGDWWGVRSEDMRAQEYARLSAAAYKAREIEKALDYANTVIELDSKHPQGPQLKAQTLFVADEFAEAKLLYEESLRRIPNDPIAHYNLGIIAFYHEKDDARAASHFITSVQIDPSYWQGHWTASLVMNRMGHPEDATITLSRYQHIPNDRAPAPLIVARIVNLYALGRRDDAFRLEAILESRHGKPAMNLLSFELKHQSFDGKQENVKTTDTVATDSETTTTE